MIEYRYVRQQQLWPNESKPYPLAYAMKQIRYIEHDYTTISSSQTILNHHQDHHHNIPIWFIRLNEAKTPHYFHAFADSSKDSVFSYDTHTHT